MNKYIDLIGPHTSEKATIVADKNNQIVFKVEKRATKKSILRAVENIFDVKVANVTVINVKGKNKQFAQRAGRRKNWKKAYVTLVSGHDIDFTGA